MIRGLAILLIFQSLGEALSRLASHAVPGPVIGLLLLWIFLNFRQQIPTTLSSAADAMLANLSIFFIPAAVGVMIYASALMSTGLAWILAIVISTVASITTTALVLRWLSPKSSATDADEIKS
jgi:holin-like protein